MAYLRSWVYAPIQLDRGIWRAVGGAGLIFCTLFIWGVGQQTVPGKHSLRLEWLLAALIYGWFATAVLSRGFLLFTIRNKALAACSLVALLGVIWGSALLATEVSRGQWTTIGDTVAWISFFSWVLIDLATILLPDQVTELDLVFWGAP